MTGAPAKSPCGSCPYRTDVPSGVWAPDEYAKLPPFDLPTAEQPHGLFLCHQQDGRLCAGWVGCHDMDESLALRLAAVTGSLSPEAVTATLDYVCPVDLFPSGAAAAAHGLADVEHPDEKALRVMSKVQKRVRARQART